MQTIFDVLKTITVNHRNVAADQVVITDPSGKPNSLLTDLLADVLGNALIFVNLNEVSDAATFVATLKEHTPLPADVLDEYAKILDETCTGINFAPKKGQVELVVMR